MFNATDADSRRALNLAEADLDCPTGELEILAGSVPSTQILADRLIAAGYVGMQVRSFAPGAVPEDLNLVMWKWSDRVPALIVLIDDEGRLSENRAM